jgi:hypothetical protein
MKRLLSLTLLTAFLFTQCKKKEEPIPQFGPEKEIGVIDISVDGVDSKNIVVKEDLIIINLPENYSGGDFIKPHITLGTGYKTQSDLVNGFSFEGKRLSLPLESNTYERRTYTVCVVPYKSVALTEPAKDYQVTLGSEVTIPVPVTFKGTAITVNDSGKIVENPLVILKDQTTGADAYRLHLDASYIDGSNKLFLPFPATIANGTYTAEIAWGAKREVLSRNLTVKSGALQLKRPTWYMLPTDRYFEVNGYNITKDGKYEMTIGNDFTAPRTVILHYKDAGTLTGNLPEDLETGNYKATYSKDGKIIEPYYPKFGFDKYQGDDQFFIKKVSEQPLLRVITQSSKAQSVEGYGGLMQTYYPSVTKISRNEPLLAYIQRNGAFPNRNDLVLTHIETRKEYAIPYSGDSATLFDGFMVFLGYEIPKDVPSGKYEVHAIAGSDKSEKYGQIINIE